MLTVRGAMLQQDAPPVAERGSPLGDIARFFNRLDTKTDGTGLAEVPFK
jgi:hypothetical protein